jgi:hypothetical protein
VSHYFVARKIVFTISATAVAFLCSFLVCLATERDMTAADEVLALAPDLVEHNSLPGQGPGRDYGLRRGITPS